MNDVDVSIIVMTYNSDVKKLFATLDSSILQDGIKKEIIICDDGSKNKNKKEIENYIIEHNDCRIFTVFNENNQGIVKNIYTGCKIANGKYIYIISPGDYFYNCNVLFELFLVAEKKSYNISVDIQFLIALMKMVQ